MGRFVDWDGDEDGWALKERRSIAPGGGGRAVRAGRDWFLEGVDWRGLS